MFNIYKIGAGNISSQQQEHKNKNILWATFALLYHSVSSYKNIPLESYSRKK